MNENNPYTKKKTIWEDEIYDPVSQEVIQDGTLFTADRMNNIEDAIEDLYDLDLEKNRRMQRVEVRLSLLDRSSSDNVFYDPIDGQEPSKMNLDATKADITAPVIVGATVLSVSSTTGFEAFTQVTIYDDVNHEDALITSIDAALKTITVQVLTNAYKKGAQVCRSNISLDFDKQEMGIANWGTYGLSMMEVV